MQARGYSTTTANEATKECALIAVDEILGTINPYSDINRREITALFDAVNEIEDSNPLKDAAQQEADFRAQELAMNPEHTYWSNVKKEIEKL